MTVEQLWQPVPGGSGTYVTELLQALAERTDVDVVGLAARHGAAPEDGRLPVPVRHSVLPRRVLYDAWQHVGGPHAERLVPGAQVVHATTWAVPATRLPLVVTVHDVAFLHDPSHFTRRGNAFFRRALERVRSRADAVVVPSATTAEECVAAGVAADRITIVPHGVKVGQPTVDDVTAWRRRAGLHREYVLWCGTIEPRKNLAGLLDAFARAVADGADLDLALVGPQGWGRMPDLPTGLDPSRVHVLGRLDRADLDAAYRGARAFCFPSFREGFGMPVLEAMAHGTPVVTSAGTACAEVAGGAALLVDPTDSGAIADALREASGPAHDELSRASAARAASATWSAAASQTVAVYRAVI